MTSVRILQKSFFSHEAISAHVGTNHFSCGHPLRPLLVLFCRRKKGLSRATPFLQGPFRKVPLPFLPHGRWVGRLRDEEGRRKMEGIERAKKREEIRRVLWCTLALFSDGGGGGGHCAKFPSPFPPSLPPDFAPQRDWVTSRTYPRPFFHDTRLYPFFLLTYSRPLRRRRRQNLRRTCSMGSGFRRASIWPRFLAPRIEEDLERGKEG